MKNRLAGSMVGDRENPLEADLGADLCRENPLIGQRAEVSPCCGGDLYGKQGEFGPITGVLKRYGRVVGYEVELNKTRYTGTRKDLYVEQCVLEDVQPATPTSVGVREALSHWNKQRDYWGPMLDGLENLCFELAAVTQEVVLTASPSQDGSGGGWKFHVPEPMNMTTVVDCRVAYHDNVWTLMVAVYPLRKPYTEIRSAGRAVVIGHEDHWERTYRWAGAVAALMIKGCGLPWQDALAGMKKRAFVTREYLRPTVGMTLPRVVAAHTKLLGPPKNVTRLSVGMSRVRLRPGTVALTEPPSDRRPYTVITLSPTAGRDADYFSQVCLHECIHLVVASRGGEPHNPQFQALAVALGLKPEYRD
jgi:hypothetical protein